jgi:hypothetical protein
VQLVRGRREGFFVEGASFRHLALILETQGEVPEQRRIACAGQCERAMVVILGYRRTVHVGEHHAEQIVRLSVVGRDGHSVPRMTLRLLGRSRALRLGGAVLERHEATARVACTHAREIQLTAARAGETAAADAERLVLDGGVC